MVLIFNPLAKTITGKVRLPLYYTGLSDVARIREQETGEGRIYPLDRGYRVELTVTLPAHAVSWYVIAAKPPHSP